MNHITYWAFRRGLIRQLGYEEDELSNEVKDRIIKDVEENWWFCGGRDTHIENDEDEEHGSVVSEAQLAKWEALWEHYFPGKAMPEPSHTCVCDKRGLRYNCFITNGMRVLIIGRVCLKQFLPKQHQEAKDTIAKRCDRCKEVHRNRKDNLCKKCRPIVKMEQRVEEETKRYEEEKRQYHEEQKRRQEEEKRRHHEEEKKREETGTRSFLNDTALLKKMNKVEQKDDRVCECGMEKAPYFPQCYYCHEKKLREQRDRLKEMSPEQRKAVVCACGKMKKPQFVTCWSCRSK